MMMLAATLGTLDVSDLQFLAAMACVLAVSLAGLLAFVVIGDPALATDRLEDPGLDDWRRP